MTAVVYQMRDYQSKKDIDRMQRELEKKEAAVGNEFPATSDILFRAGIPIARLDTSPAVPFGGQGIDGMTFTDKDSA